MKYFEAATQDPCAVASTPSPPQMPWITAMPASTDWPAKDEGEEEPYIYHFPDGNASIARLLVRSLVPGVAKARPWKTSCSPISTIPSSIRPADAHPLEQHRRRGANRARRQGRGRYRLCRARQSAPHQGEAIRARLLQHDHPLPDAGATRGAEGGAGDERQGAAGLRQRRDPQLAIIPELGVQQVYSPTAFFSLVKLDYPVALGGYQNPEDPTSRWCCTSCMCPASPTRG